MDSDAEEHAKTAVTMTMGQCYEQEDDSFFLPQTNEVNAIRAATMTMMTMAVTMMMTIAVNKLR